MRDPLDFARAHVGPRSLCSELVVAWLDAHGAGVGLSRREQFLLWRSEGVRGGAQAVAERLGIAEATEGRDGDVCLSVTAGGPTLGLLRAGRFVAAAAGVVTVQDAPILCIWRAPCLS